MSFQVNALEDRFRGVLLGIALGDALGLPANGLTARAIARRLGRIDRFRLLGQTGFVSDDTELSALIWEGGWAHDTASRACLATSSTGFTTVRSVRPIYAIWLAAWSRNGKGVIVQCRGILSRRQRRGTWRSTRLSWGTAFDGSFRSDGYGRTRSDGFSTSQALRFLRDFARERGKRDGSSIGNLG